MTNFLISQIKKLELVQEIFFSLILKKAIKEMSILISYNELIELCNYHILLWLYFYIKLKHQR